jgi:hypothetical protein
MPTATDFRVFKIDPDFGGVESSDDETIVAKLRPSGKPAPFALNLFANFERGTLESRSEAIPVRGEFRVYFGQALLHRTPVQTTIPSGRPSANQQVGSSRGDL